MKPGNLVVPRHKMIGTPACGACKHVHEVFGPAGPAYLCRRFPPVPFPIIAMSEHGPTQAGTVSNWPSVLPDQVCGEFKLGIVQHGHARAG